MKPFEPKPDQGNSGALLAQNENVEGVGRCRKMHGKCVHRKSVKVIDGLSERVELMPAGESVKVIGL